MGGVWQGTHGGWAVQFAAAKDDQTAADTAQLSGDVSTGAATYAFIQVGITSAWLPAEP